MCYGNFSKNGKKYAKPIKNILKVNRPRPIAFESINVVTLHIKHNITNLQKTMMRQLRYLLFHYVTLTIRRLTGLRNLHYQKHNFLFV